jgi:hypothetical protein
MDTSEKLGLRIENAEVNVPLLKQLDSEKRYLNDLTFQNKRSNRNDN